MNPSLCSFRAHALPTEHSGLLNADGYLDPELSAHSKQPSPSISQSRPHHGPWGSQVHDGSPNSPGPISLKVPKLPKLKLPPHKSLLLHRYSPAQPGLTRSAPEQLGGGGKGRFCPRIAVFCVFPPILPLGASHTPELPL